MRSRKYIVAVIFLILLIWGPITDSSLEWLSIRIFYLIAIPLFASFILNWIWKQWKPDKKTEIRVENLLAYITCIVLIIMAIIAFMADTHIGNTLWVHSSDGMEAVGDDILLEGPNWGTFLILIFGACLSLWFGITNKETE